MHLYTFQIVGKLSLFSITCDVCGEKGKIFHNTILDPGLSWPVLSLSSRLNISGNTANLSPDIWTCWAFWQWLDPGKILMLILGADVKITWYSDVIDNITPTRTRQEVKNPKATHMMVHCLFFSFLAFRSCLSNLKCLPRLSSGVFSGWEESSPAPVIFTKEQSLTEWERKVGRATRELLRVLSRSILDGEKDPNLNNLQKKIICYLDIWIIR